MHQRLHERNNKKLSIIGFDLTNFVNLDTELKEEKFNDLLKFIQINKINFISIPYQNKQLFEFLLSWEISNNFSFIKSILIDFTEYINNLKKDFTNKNDDKTNFVQYLFNFIKEIVDTYKLSQIEFLSLEYFTTNQVMFDELNEQITSIKENKLVGSFGIHCNSLADALIICKKVNIDHLEINIDLNTSFELLNSLFKIAKSKQIAVFCFLETHRYSPDIITEQKIDPLTTLLLQGKENVYKKVITGLEITEKEFSALVLRKYIEYDFQSIFVNSIDLEKNSYLVKALTHPYITNEEQLILQNSLQSYSYESPKGHK